MFRVTHNESNRRVLVVDDDEDMLDCLVSMLSGRSWIVEAVSNPLDAVQRIQDFQFDVIVTDIHMPQMSGTDLMDHAKSMQPHLKVVLISGQKPSESITADAFAFLAKPFKSAHLVSVVERALSERTHARHESSPPR